MNNHRFFKKYYWIFLLNSCNQHGIHSPFVYHLTTECFYKGSKKEGILLRLINYLNLKSVYFHTAILASENDDFKELIRMDTPSKSEIIVITNGIQNYRDYQEIATQLQDQCLLLFKNPYENPDLINTIEQNNTSKVIINIYDYVFIFRKDGQVAQNFKIRFF